MNLRIPIWTYSNDAKAALNGQNLPVPAPGVNYDPTVLVYICVFALGPFFSPKRGGGYAFNFTIYIVHCKTFFSFSLHYVSFLNDIWSMEIMLLVVSIQSLAYLLPRHLWNNL